MTVKFPKLYPWQQDVFDAVTNDNGAGDWYLTVARRQCGKSVTACAIALYYAFKEKSIGLVAEPTLRQARRIWKQIVSAVGGEGSPILKSANSMLLSIEFVNGSEIHFISAEMDDSAKRGFTVKKSVLIIDEGAFIDQDTYEVLQPVVDVTNSPVLMISTPLFKDGMFYERYKRGIEGDKHIHVFNWRDYDTSALLSNEKLEYYRNTISPLKFKSEYLGEFIDENSFIFGDIFQCVAGYSTKAAVYAGVDWSAGSDGDYTVITFLDEDNHVVGLKYWKDFDAVDLVKELATEIKAHPKLKKVKIEKNSIGKIFYDMLKREVRQGLLLPFITTNESKREIIESLISAFQTGEIQVPKEPELIKELQHYAMEKTPSGKYTYNASENYHDDFVISLALAYSNAPSHKNTENKIRVTLI